MTKTTVLIVEDEEIVAADLAAKVEQLGYEVVGSAASGEEAVELACRLKPQVVLMDIRLKGAMDGIEAAEAMLRRHSAPVIYLTAYSDAATLERAKLSQPYGYVLKPFEERELSTTIEMALYKHKSDLQLREQREWLRVTLTSIGDAVITCGTNGLIDFLNPVAEALTGWSIEEARERPIGEIFRLINEQTRQPSEDPVALVLREGRPKILANHTALVTRKGLEIPIEDSASPILDAGGRVIGVVLVFHDVTEKRRAQEALRVSEERFRSIAENMSEGLMLFNPHGDLIYQNPASLKTHGYSVTEDGGIALGNLEPTWQGWDDKGSPLPFDQWPVSRVFRGERVLNQVVHARRLDTGKEFVASYNGTPIYDAAGSMVLCFITIREITEQRKAERALRESENQFGVLVQNLQTAVALVNEHGEFKIVNQAFLRTFDLPDDANVKNVNDRDWSQWQVLDESGSLLAVDEHPVREAALKGSHVRDKLVAVKTPKGEELKWLLVSAEPILDDQDQIKRLICTYHDITSRKQAEDDLKKLNEDLDNTVMQRTNELREKDQMLLKQSRQAAMGEMIGNIAHQWRQPLNTLGLTIQQLKLYYELGEFTEEFLDQSVRSSMDLLEHMSKTIDDFRNYFKPDKKKAEFNLSEAIGNTLSLVEDSLKCKNINIELIANGDPVIYGYRNEFAQVLLNILNNASDVIVERERVNPKVTITFGIEVGSEGAHSVITIADNAGGIPEEIISKVFEPYFSTKGPQQGTGIGLYMSKTIIEKNMGGRLTARNLTDGAEFRIEV